MDVRNILLAYVSSHRPESCYSAARGLWVDYHLGRSLPQRVQVPNISGLWFQKPYSEWFLGPESLDIGCRIVDSGLHSAVQDESP